MSNETEEKGRTRSGTKVVLAEVFEDNGGKTIKEKDGEKRLKKLLGERKDGTGKRKSTTGGPSQVESLERSTHGERAGEILLPELSGTGDLGSAPSRGGCTGGRGKAISSEAGGNKKKKIVAVEIIRVRGDNPRSAVASPGRRSSAVRQKKKTKISEGPDVPKCPER